MFFGADLAVVVLGHALVPTQDVDVGLQLFQSHLSASGLNSQVTLHVPQRHRQQRVRQLDHTKRRSGKFGNRRRVAGAHLHRKAGNVGQAAARVVFQSSGHFHREVGVLRQRRGEVQRAHITGFIVFIEHRH